MYYVFIVFILQNIYLQEKLYYIILIYFLEMTIKRISKEYRSILKINMAEEASLEFKLKKIDET